MMFLILENERSFLKHLTISINHRYKIEIAIYCLHYLKNGNKKWGLNVGPYT